MQTPDIQIALIMQEKKRGETLYPESCYLLENMGMEGDKYADGSEKQISLLSLECVKWMQGLPKETRGLCFDRIKANFIFISNKNKSWKVGENICLGEAEISLTHTQKKCFFHECSLAQSGKECLLKKYFYYAKVIRTGKVFLNSAFMKDADARKILEKSFKRLEKD